MNEERIARSGRQQPAGRSPAAARSSRLGDSPQRPAAAGWEIARSSSSGCESRAALLLKVSGVRFSLVSERRDSNMRPQARAYMPATEPMPLRHAIENVLARTWRLEADNCMIWSAIGELTQKSTSSVPSERLRVAEDALRAAEIERCRLEGALAASEHSRAEEAAAAELAKLEEEKARVMGTDYRNVSAVEVPVGVPGI